MQRSETFIVCYSQVQFQGVTGLVAFDERGFRKDYKLAVHELNLDNPVRKVCSLLYKYSFFSIDL